LEEEEKGLHMPSDLVTERFIFILLQ